MAGAANLKVIGELPGQQTSALMKGGVESGKKALEAEDEGEPPEGRPGPD